MLLVPRPPLLDSALDLATLSLVSILLLVSILSAFFLLHLRIKARSAPHLLEFNSLWTVKLLLVTHITLWSIAELLRAPLFRRKYGPSPLLPSLPLTFQAGLCKLHVVVSLGFLEPAFLVTILFLVNVSIRKSNPRGFWAAFYVAALCLPLAMLQAFFAFFPPADMPFPHVLARTSVQFRDQFGHETVLCSYPLMGTVIFAAFAITYCLCFLVSCWKVVSLVINKGLRARIYTLGMAILIPLPAQLLLLGLSVLWSPEQRTHSGIAFGVFASALVCAAAGEGILIIRPSSDALAAGGDTCRWIPGHQPRPLEEDPRLAAVVGP